MEMFDENFIEEMNTMLSYYKTENGRMEQLPSCEPGCWINCVAPDDREVNSLISDFGIEPDFFARRWMRRSHPISTTKMKTH